MMNLDFRNVRTINGDTKDGFEELVVQLARRENIQDVS